MANQYTKFNRLNVIRKIYRKNNPVMSITDLAAEFKMPRTSLRRALDKMLTHDELEYLTRETSKFSS